MISADIYYSYLELVLLQIDVFKLPEIWSPFSEEEENTWGWWCCDPCAECWHIVPTLIGKNQKATTKCQKTKAHKNFHFQLEISTLQLVDSLRSSSNNNKSPKNYTLRVQLCLDFFTSPPLPKTLWPHPPNLVPFIESFCLSFTIPQSLFQIPSISKL
jgi:hypothetical protein